MKKFKILCLVLVSVLVVVAIAGCSKKTAAVTTIYQEVTVGTGNVTVSITTTGTMDYADYENLSFGADGTVGAVNVKVGDLVKKGQVLATLDADSWNQQLKSLAQAVQTAQRNLITAQSNLAKAQRQVITQQLSVSQAQLNLQTAQNSLSNMSSVKTAQDAVDAAQSNLDAAQSNLLVANAQGDTAAATYLNGYITFLKQQLSQAQQNRQQILSGTSTTITSTVALQVASAQLQVTMAQNSLDGANVAVTDANTAVTNAQMDEVNAEQTVKDAQKALDNAKAASIEIDAPFDGAVTTVSVSTSGVVKKGATAIVLADTSKFKANMMVNEMDIPNVSVGMTATVQASALPNLTLPARVTAISPVSTSQSGVVNYAVTATVLQVTIPAAGTTNPATPSGSTGQTGMTTTPTTTPNFPGRLPSTTTTAPTTTPNSSGQVPLTTTTTTPQTFSGTGRQTGGGLIGQSNTAATAQLRQGLSLTINLIEQQKQDVLVVPNQAVKTQGTTSTVLVKTSTGTETRQVTIGLKDYQNTEIVSGLSQGDVVLIAKTTSTTTTTTTTPGGGDGFGIGGGILR